MLTALICLCGLCVLELYAIIILALWARKISKENEDLSAPVLPISFDDED